jgi:hypothetical protein
LSPAGFTQCSAESLGPRPWGPRRARRQLQRVDDLEHSVAKACARDPDGLAQTDDRLIHRDRALEMLEQPEQW